MEEIDRHGYVCGLGICTECLEEMKASYGCLSDYLDVSMMLCRALYTNYITRIGDKDKRVFALLS